MSARVSLKKPCEHPEYTLTSPVLLNLLSDLASRSTSLR